jgi:hypothetical protein
MLPPVVMPNKANIFFQLSKIAPSSDPGISDVVEDLAGPLQIESSSSLTGSNNSMQWKAELLRDLPCEDVMRELIELFFDPSGPQLPAIRKFELRLDDISET